jgi:hypothetical protein
MEARASQFGRRSAGPTQLSYLDSLFRRQQRHLVEGHEPVSEDFVHLMPSSVTKAWTGRYREFRGISQPSEPTSRGRHKCPRFLGRKHLDGA